MNIDEIRIYAEVLEQGLDFCSYIKKMGYSGKITNIYAKKYRNKNSSEFEKNDSVIDKIRKLKDVDVLLSAVSNGCEYPLLMVEYSTAVPTDDHKMQRSDVYFWSSYFCVPIMKISPDKKGMGQKFGGGSKITNDDEQRVSLEHKSVFYQIAWETPCGKDVLPAADNKLSCIPYNDDIFNAVSEIISTFSLERSHKLFYKKLLEKFTEKYATLTSGLPIENIQKKIVNSTRFHWYDKRISVKINRFGHAMDPDRGVLYFMNMLVGAENLITEIQVNRADDPAAKKGYNSFFDGLSQKNDLLKYVAGIEGNIFTDENALYVLRHGLGIEDDELEMKKVKDHVYSVDDETLYMFLNNHKALVPKTIFFLSTELKLTDKNRSLICTVTWNNKPIEKYLAKISEANSNSTDLVLLNNKNASEDIITFASVELYKKMQCGLLAVSYPGAQGDRCILTGKGRKVRRTYVDIIAYNVKNNGIKVYLGECKDQLSKSKEDVKKLNKISNDSEQRNGLKLLFKKNIDADNITDLYISVAAKTAKKILLMDVDYIFMFNISSDKEHTYIDYTIAVINTAVIPDFALLGTDGKLKGRLTFAPIYTII